MSRKRGLTRRSVLSGVATVGSVGAVSGVGAVGLFSDEEVFTGNLLTAGELDLQLCWGEGGEDCNPQSGPVTLNFGPVEKGEEGTATIQCNLEDNPGWTWLRTNCPDGPCGLQEAVTVSLWYDWNCNGERNADEPYLRVSLDESQQNAVEGNLSSAIEDITTPIEIRNLPLCDALTILRFGTLLDSDQSAESEGPDPIKPGEWCCLGFEWSVDEYICVEDSFEIEFEFYTKQWRHNPEPSHPWSDVSTCEVDCTEDCEDCSPKQGISFVAFCTEDGEINQGDIKLLPFYDVEDEVYKVKWWSDTPLDWVVLFYGSNDGKYFENFEVDGATSGVVHVNSSIHTPSDPDYDSKLLWEGGQDTTDYGQCPKDPCPDFMNDYGCGVRYNFENSEDYEGDPGTWDDVCGQTCPGENGGQGGGSGGGNGGGG